MKINLILKIFSPVLLMILSDISALAQGKIAFNVTFSEPQAHYADVQMDLSDIKKDYVDIKMPVWAPGSYLVREFSKNVEGFSAKNKKNETLPVQKLNKNTWRVSTSQSDQIKINYRVYAFEISVRTSFIDASHAFLSPSGIFMYPDGLINHPVTVAVKPYTGWSKISTGMELVSGSSDTFYAPDYDILYDSPIEVGNQDVFEFTAAGVKHEVVMAGGGNYNKDRLKQDMAKIVEEETKIFSENPNKRYVFIVQNYLTGAGGGIEHLNSTVLGAARLGYASEAGHKGFLGLVSHEYFHLWNVKRLRPKALGPFDYDNENYTSNLWIAEGFTSYYDDLVMQRTGFNTPDKYLDGLATTINGVENQPGNRFQPVSESSLEAWIKYYRPNENSKNSGISYYDKGSLIALLFDLEIINASKGQKSLDDLMKGMYDEYYKKQKRGYTDAEFRTMAETLAGKSFDKIYTDYINGTQPIDYNTYLEYAGLRLVNDNAGKNDPYLGIAAAAANGKIMITNVSRGSAAWKYGLNTNDELIGIDGVRIANISDPNSSDVNRVISGKKVGDKIPVVISRDGMLQTLELTLGANPNLKYRFESVSNPTEAQLTVRKKWLKL
jgi:predicted metalloprotease with PDZ domain